MGRTHTRARRRRQQRGFALLVIILLVAMISVVGVSMLQIVQLDLDLGGQSRRTLMARLLAEGGSNEVLNDIGTQALLPLPGDAELSKVYPLATVNDFTNPGDVKGTYSASLRYLRYVPILESSITWTRGLIYEAQVVGDFGDGQATDEVRTEFYRVVNFAPGHALPRKHYR